MSDIPQGTSLEDIEMGDVKNAADSVRMREILADMNADDVPDSRGGAAQENVIPPAPRMQQRMQPMPPMRPQIQYEEMDYQQQQYEEPRQPRYRPVETEQPAATPKKNVWSTAIEYVRDPMVVALLVLVLSLPAIHTFVGKYASWAYKVSGQLSWIGLSVFALVGGLLFGLYRVALQMIA
jgi:hypothetical protein